MVSVVVVVVVVLAVVVVVVVVVVVGMVEVVVVAIVMVMLMSDDRLGFCVFRHKKTHHPLTNRPTDQPTGRQSSYRDAWTPI